MYKAQIGYTMAGHNRWKYFETLEEAQEFANMVCRRFRIILTIIKNN